MNNQLVICFLNNKQNMSNWVKVIQLELALGHIGLNYCSLLPGLASIFTICPPLGCVPDTNQRKKGKVYAA